MANRTLRRSYSGANQDAGSVSISDGIDERSESERFSGKPNADNGTLGNGTDTESNTVSDGGSVRIVEIEPNELTEYIERDSNGNGDSGEPRKRRGRKPGTKNRTGAKKAADSVKPFLLMAHTWASVLLKTPEIALSEDEAEQLNTAYCTFCEYHEIPLLTAKRMSEINLISALFFVYGPRYVAIRNRHKEEKRAKNAKNVTPIVAVN
jgi:hypothetical protein